MDGLDAAFDVLDASGDGRIGFDNFERLLNVSSALRRTVDLSSIQAALVKASGSSENPTVTRSEFRQSFLTALKASSPAVAQDVKSFCSLITRAGFMVAFAQLCPDGMPLSRSFVGDFIEHVQAKAKEALPSYRAARVADVLSAHGPNQRTDSGSAFVSQDEFCEAMERVVNRGVVPQVILRGAATYKPLAPSSPPRPRSPSTSKSPTAGVLSAADAEKIRSLQFQVIELKKEVDSLHADKERLTKLIASSSSNSSTGKWGAPASANSNSAASAAAAQAAQQQVLMLLQTVATAEAANRDLTQQLEEKDALLAASREETANLRSRTEKEKRLLESELLSTRSQLAVLEKYAKNQQSWTTMFENVDKGLRSVLSAGLGDMDRLKSEETQHRVAVAARLLDDASRKLAQSEASKARAEALLDEVARREREVQLGEAVLAAKEQKFATYQRKVEQTSLPERARRLELLRSVERQVEVQMHGVRDFEAELLLKEKRLVSENEILRRQCEILTSALNDLRLANSPAKPFKTSDEYLTPSPSRSASENVVDHKSLSPSRTFYW